MGSSEGGNVDLPKEGLAAPLVPLAEEPPPNVVLVDPPAEEEPELEPEEPPPDEPEEEFPALDLPEHSLFQQAQEGGVFRLLLALY